MTKRTSAPGQPMRSTRATSRTTAPRSVPPRRSQHHTLARHRTPHRPTQRRQQQRTSVAHMRQDLTYLLVMLLLMLVVVSPLMPEALIVFDKLLPFLTLALGHYFGQK